jgi:hypothetical protein
VKFLDWNSTLDRFLDSIWPQYAPSISPMKLFIESGGKVIVDDMRTARTELQKNRIQFWIGERNSFTNVLKFATRNRLTL